MNIGDNIKTVRKSKGLPQKKLAEMLDIPISTLANYENNHREPSIETLNKISNILGVTINDLAGEKDTAIKQTIERLIAGGISLPVLSKETGIDLANLESMLNNSINVPVGDIRKLGKYIGLSDDVIAQMIMVDTFTSATFNNKDNDPDANLIKKYFLDEPITKEEFLNSVVDEDKEFLGIIYSNILDETLKSKTSEKPEASSETTDFDKLKKERPRYLSDSEYFYDSLRLRIVDIAMQSMIEVTSDDVEHIVNEVSSTIRYELFKIKHK